MEKTMIEFFSGSKIMSETFKANGYEVFTIDFNEKLNPDLAINILDFDIKKLPSKFHNPYVCWFSPPCTTFSVATISRHWKNGKSYSSKNFMGLALVMKCLEIIKELKPKYWFIENPRGMLRKQWFMRELPRKTVTYCQYGETTQKPTDIWTNAVHWIPKKSCKAGDNCHEYQPRTYERKLNRGVLDLGIQGKANAFERAKIPGKLCEEIVKVCNNQVTIKQEVLK